MVAIQERARGTIFWTTQILDEAFFNGLEVVLELFGHVNFGCRARNACSRRGWLHQKRKRRRTDAEVVHERLTPHTASFPVAREVWGS